MIAQRLKYLLCLIVKVLPQDEYELSIPFHSPCLQICKVFANTADRSSYKTLGEKEYRDVLYRVKWVQHTQIYMQNIHIHMYKMYIFCTMDRIWFFIYSFLNPPHNLLADCMKWQVAEVNAISTTASLMGFTRQGTMIRMTGFYFIIRLH